MERRNTAIQRLLCVLSLLVLLDAPLHAATQASKSTVKFGIDNLIDLNFEPLKGKKIALVATVASRNRFLEETVQLLSARHDMELCALLTPEHGYFAQVPAGEHVSGEIIYGIPTYSLYAKNRRPTKQMIGNCDAVVLDLQDIGLRPYTFISTMVQVMDACAEFDKEVYVLDRPNPLGGQTVDGSLVDADSRSFVASLPIPYIHGMTMGELALMINEEGWLPKDAFGRARKCHLTVVKMKRWRRTMSWESIDHTWVPTSPNIPSINAIRGMALTGLMGELSVFSIGIGTSLPFQYLGIPENAQPLVDSLEPILRAFNIKTVPTRFTPSGGKYAGQSCRGYMLDFDAQSDVPFFSAAVELMLAIRHSRPTAFRDSVLSLSHQQMFSKVAGTRLLLSWLADESKSDEEIRALMRKGREQFASTREKYLLYN